MRRALAVLALVVAGSTATAHEIHVHPDGDDGGGRGTVARPFATPQRGVEAAGPGDEVLLHAGTYADCDQGGTRNKERLASILHVTSGGTAERPLTIRAAGDGPAVLQASPGCKQAIWIDRRAGHVVVGGELPGRGLVVRGNFELDEREQTRAATVRVEGPHVSIVGNTLEGTAHPALLGPGRPAGKCNNCAEILFTGREALVAPLVAWNDVRVRNVAYGVHMSGGALCDGDACPESRAVVRDNAITALPSSDGPLRDVFGMKLKDVRGILVTRNVVTVGTESAPARGLSLCFYVRDHQEGTYEGNVCEMACGSGICHGFDFQDSRRGIVERHLLIGNVIRGRGTRAFDEDTVQCTDCVFRDNRVEGLGPGRGWQAIARCAPGTNYAGNRGVHVVSRACLEVSAGPDASRH